MNIENSKIEILKQGQKLKIKFNEPNFNLKIDFLTYSYVKIYASNENESIIKIIDIKSNSYIDNQIMTVPYTGEYNINVKIENGLNYLNIECVKNCSKFYIDDFIYYDEYELKRNENIYIKTISEYLNAINCFDQKMMTFSNKTYPTFFRGHSNHEYQLQSTLDRISKNVNLHHYISLVNQFKNEINAITNESFQLLTENDYELITKVNFNLNQDHDKIKTLDKHFLTFIRHYGFPSPLS